MLESIAAEPLEACLEWIYTGTCVAADHSVLFAVLEAAIYLQVTTDAISESRPVYHNTKKQ